MLALLNHMGKIRVAALGDEAEKEQKRRADARRQTKKSKKIKVEGVGMKGGERVAMVEGTDIKPEFQKLVDEVESTEGQPSVDKSKPKKEKKTRIRSKRYIEARSLVDQTKIYSLGEAMSLVKRTSLTKFDGTVELHVNLNPMAMSDKKDLRGTIHFPHGTGKEVRVVVADDKVLADIEKGTFEFDMLVAHPSMMPKLAKFARLLGPKGLMPNPKNGTVTTDPEAFVKSVAKGTVHFKTEPDQPILHLVIGKVSFQDNKLMENIEAAFAAIGRAKIRSAVLSATMGPGIKLAIT